MRASPPSLHQITHIHCLNPWREEARSWSESSRHPGKASDTQPIDRRVYGGRRRRSEPARSAGMAWRYHPTEEAINQPDGPRTPVRPRVEDRDLIGAPPGAHPRHGGWGRLGKDKVSIQMRSNKGRKSGIYPKIALSKMTKRLQIFKFSVLTIFRHFGC